MLEKSSCIFRHTGKLKDAMIPVELTRTYSRLEALGPGALREVDEPARSNSSIRFEASWSSGCAVFLRIFSGHYELLQGLYRAS